MDTDRHAARLPESLLFRPDRPKRAFVPWIGGHIDQGTGVRNAEVCCSRSQTSGHNALGHGYGTTHHFERVHIEWHCQKRSI